MDFVLVWIIKYKWLRCRVNGSHPLALWIDSVNRIQMLRPLCGSPYVYKWLGKEQYLSMLLDPFSYSAISCWSLQSPFSIIWNSNRSTVGHVPTRTLLQTTMYALRGVSLCRASLLHLIASPSSSHCSSSTSTNINSCLVYVQNHSALS